MRVHVCNRYNAENGGPAPEKLTNAIYEGTKTISKYYTADIPPVDISKVGSYSYLVQHAGGDKFGQFTVEVYITILAKNKASRCNLRDRPVRGLGRGQLTELPLLTCALRADH